MRKTDDGKLHPTHQAHIIEALRSMVAIATHKACIDELAPVKVAYDQAAAILTDCGVEVPADAVWPEHADCRAASPTEKRVKRANRRSCNAGTVARRFAVLKMSLDSHGRPVMRNGEPLANFVRRSGWDWSQSDILEFEKNAALALREVQRNKSTDEKRLQAKAVVLQRYVTLGHAMLDGQDVIPTGRRCADELRELRALAAMAGCAHELDFDGLELVPTMLATKHQIEHEKSDGLGRRVLPYLLSPGERRRLN